MEAIADEFFLVISKQGLFIKLQRSKMLSILFKKVYF